MYKNFVKQLFKYLLFTAITLYSYSPVMANSSIQTESMETIISENGKDTEDNKTEIKGPAKKTGENVEINGEFFRNLGIDIFFLIIIIGFIYYPNYRKLDTIFTFVLFNLIIYMLTYVFNEVKISMGAAFGLFAVFSMLRYRTSSISMKDMTYLFIFIGIGLLSAIQMDWYEHLIIGGIIFVITFIMDTKLILKKESFKSVRFEDVTLILPEKETELIEVLKKRTGLNIHRIAVQEIDYLRDIAIIYVYYYE